MVEDFKKNKLHPHLVSEDPLTKSLDELRQVELDSKPPQNDIGLHNRREDALEFRYVMQKWKTDMQR